MSLFNDFTYLSGAPVPRKWHTFAATGHWVTPVPPAITPLPRPPSHGLEAIGVSAAAAYWHALTMGYGAAADYAIHWLLNGFVLGPNEIEDLRRLAAARATSISRAYRFTEPLAGPTLQIDPRAIYSLIEPSEKVNISYYIGCAMASICVPRAINLRPGAPGAGISFIFHASLLEAAAKTAKRVIVHSRGSGNVDFVCFDVNLGVHLIEAKGSGDKFTMSSLVKGVEQCLNVIDVELPAGRVSPVTLNVATTYSVADPVVCLGQLITQSLRCTVVQVIAPDVQARAEPLAQPYDALHHLIGTQVLGLVMYLTTAEARDLIDDWAPYSFTDPTRPDEPLLVAVPSQLILEVKRQYDETVQAVNIIRNRQQLEYALKDNEVPDPEQEVRNWVDAMLLDLGGWVLQQNRWAALPIPQGFLRDPIESWIALPAPPPA